MNEKQKRLHDAVQEIVDAFESYKPKDERTEIIARALCEHDANDFDRNAESVRRRYRETAKFLSIGLSDAAHEDEDEDQ